MSRADAEAQKYRPGLTGYLQGLLLISCLLISAGKSSSQETGHYADFGYHAGFDFTVISIDKCKTYYDSTSHLLFNPCFDFRNRGIYSSYLARQVLLRDCVACDSVSLLLPHPVSSIDWEYLQKQQQQAWDYYFRLWKKQDRIEKYYIDLEGVVRGAMSKPF